MNELLRTVSPIDGAVVVERPYATAAELDALLERARRAQAAWRARPVAERADILSRAVDAFVAERPRIARELTLQMGRPIAHSPGEVGGFEERARFMIGIAADALADLPAPDPKPGFTRFIRREPLGTVLVVAPWNYPYLTAVNAIVPALMAGNAVLLKPSSQTPLTAERMADAFAAAGLPDGLFQYAYLDHAATDGLIRDSRIDFVAFTGSVEGGRAVQRAAAERFIGVGLELGGKDPAYVRADADLEYSLDNLADGVFFNAGQSCCGIERIYVHRPRYDAFVEGFVARARRYVLGNPLDPATTLGPMVRTRAAEAVRAQIAEAVASGARSLIDEAEFPASGAGTPYLAPQVLVDVDHGMRVMMEESFGPVVGIMPVDSDAQAVALMNDSPYGLTASIWTADEAAALELGGNLATGTCFMNRCDYLDPALAWTGVGDSGRGCTLSPVGYEQLTRPKSYHLKTRI
ncbi:aldehyde dehydrogenase family protein [Acidihalobacter ferrooxydans]|uniref:Aldehyde dehydrogenase n=1 Tax=Acidihalobacter ferrooxydans TaxID=1765967 RepID=A0A1P8UKN5_9GAMM|nr:aldehyde dehydrogenase family protein [Acidihalobacter ferrooxydans]APZ44401.1 aldehyde dehydrogenase [Acidihalobacter ferrooxydans]